MVGSNVIGFWSAGSFYLVFLLGRFPASTFYLQYVSVIIKLIFMNTDLFAPEIKRLIKEYLNDYLHSPEFRQLLESIISEEEKYMTREELCRYARLSPSTLWRIEKRQAIPHTMVGGRKLYVKKEVDRLIAEGRLSLYSQQNQETSNSRRSHCSTNNKDAS
ncbi:MAG: helix-turn-helix domain-containing protein [Prevotella sp.]|nr:helix-turn-helix domain-containing protein [Prevotella sp.]